MHKSATFALLAAGLSSGMVVGGGTAHADQKYSPVQETAPQSITDVLRVGSGTVVGSVTAVGAKWFTVSDETGQTDVTVGGFLPEGIRKDDPITVTGRARHGGLRASEIILADGTAHGSVPKKTENARLDEDDD